MAVAKEANEEAVNKDFLSDDHAGDFSDERFHPLAVVLDMLGELGCIDTHGMFCWVFKTGRRVIRSILGESPFGFWIRDIC
jgi:hypothetical protein